MAFNLGYQTKYILKPLDALSPCEGPVKNNFNFIQSLVSVLCGLNFSKPKNIQNFTIVQLFKSVINLKESTALAL